MAYFPMFVDMTDRPCLIVGGGNVAYRKVLVMLDFGAKVTVVAEDICDEIRSLATSYNDNSNDSLSGKKADKKETDKPAADKICAKEYDTNKEISDKETFNKVTHNKVVFCERKFDQKDCNGMQIVIAATDDNALNHEIAEYCKSKGIMVNAVDQKADCSFIFPSYIKEKNLVAAFSSGGNSPVLAQYLKGKEQEILTPFLGELNEYMGQIREAVLSGYDTEAERKSVFKEIVCKAIDSGKLPEV